MLVVANIYKISCNNIHKEDFGFVILYHRTPLVAASGHRGLTELQIQEADLGLLQHPKWSSL